MSSYNEINFTRYDFGVDCNFLQKIYLKKGYINSQYFAQKSINFKQLFISFNKFSTIMVLVWPEYL